jgi:hypothetical protein
MGRAMSFVVAIMEPAEPIDLGSRGFPRTVGWGGIVDALEDNNRPGAARGCLRLADESDWSSGSPRKALSIRSRWPLMLLTTTITHSGGDLISVLT